MQHKAIAKLRQSARGMECQVRVPGICNHNPETTVLAHLNGGGMGAKHHDLFGAFACSDCHAWLDGGYAKDSDRRERDLIHHQGVIRTQAIWLNEGLINVN